MDAQPDANDVMADIAADIRTIVRNEVELAKAEIVPGVKKAGLGAGLLVVALIFLTIFLQVLFMSLGFAMSGIFWDKNNPSVGAFGWGFLVAAAIYLLLALGAVVVAFLMIKRLKMPKRTIAVAEEAISTLQNAVSAGLQDVQETKAKGTKKLGTDETGTFITYYANSEASD